MNREFWIDGFNFFHHWENTRRLLRPDSGMDIVRAMDRALRTLGSHLGGRCRHTVVFMDGGLSRFETAKGPLRIRYCGPGRKADDRMAGDLEELHDDARMVTAVSNDRELKARLRTLGASCLGVGEFLALAEGRKRDARGGGKKTHAARPAPNGGEDAEIMRQKCKGLSASEVKAWLEFFGGDEEM